MLQQTTVVTVIPYFHRFIERWPTITALADATLDDVYHAWQGLGYYSRARNLHKCAQELVQNHQGIIPQQESLLLTLPGIGPYTAAAISAIAYDQPTVPVDGNVIRVFSRLEALSTPLPALKNEIIDIVKEYGICDRSGDFAQSLMDLGATICLSRRPNCVVCPLTDTCLAYQKNKADSFPVKMIKSEKPVRHGVIFWIETYEGAVLIRRRPSQGLLANLMEFPGTPWVEKIWEKEDALKNAPLQSSDWVWLPILIKHTFTHFHLRLRVVKTTVSFLEQEGLWIPPEEFLKYAFPTVMKKIMASVFSSAA